MTKKITALMLCALIALTFVVGCSNTQTEEGSTSNDTETADNDSGTSSNDAEGPKPVTISVGNWPLETNEVARKNMEQSVATMKEKYPYITIEPDEYVYDVNSFLPKAESGQLPTLYSTWFTEPEKIIEAGYAADITDAMERYGYDTGTNPDMLELVTKEGKMYGVPISGYSMGMWYNVNLFKQAGLLDEKGVPKFPRTYDELAETAKILKDKTGKPGLFFATKNNQGGWFFMNIAWAYGAEFEKQVDGKWQAVFNSPEAVAALQYVKDLKWKYDVLPDNVLVATSDMFRLFGTDQVAMSFGTVDWMQNPINDYKMSKDNLAMSVLPSGPKGKAALMGGNLNMFAPNATPEQIDAGFKWLEIRGVTPKISPQTLKALEDGYKADNEAGRIVGPPRLRVWVDPERVKAEDEIRTKYTNVNMDLWNDYVEHNSENIRPEEPVNSQELYKTLDNVIQAVLTDKNADPKALLDKAVTDFQRDYLDKAN